MFNQDTILSCPEPAVLAWLNLYMFNQDTILNVLNLLFLPDRARSPVKRRSRTPSPRTRAREKHERDAQRKEKEKEDSLREEESYEARQLQRKQRGREKAYKEV